MRPIPARTEARSAALRSSMREKKCTIDVEAEQRSRTPRTPRPRSCEDVAVERLHGRCALRESATAAIARRTFGVWSAAQAGRVPFSASVLADGDERQVDDRHDEHARQEHDRAIPDSERDPERRGERAEEQRPRAPSRA